MKIKDIDIVKIHVDMPKNNADTEIVDMMLQKGFRNIGSMFHRITCNVSVQYRKLIDGLKAYFVSSLLSSSTDHTQPIFDEQGVYTAGTVTLSIGLGDIIGFMSRTLPPRLQPMLQEVNSIKEYVDAINAMLTDDSNKSTQLYNWDMFTKAFGLRIELLGLDPSKQHPFKMRLKKLYDRYPAFKDLGEFACYIPTASISIQDIVNGNRYHETQNALYAFYTESEEGLFDIYHVIDNILYLDICDFYYDGACHIVCAIDVNATANEDFVKKVYQDILKAI